jgi:hypothetical protein
MPKPRDGDKEAAKSVYEITVMLIGSIIWPVMILGFLFVFREPIRAITAQLPALIASSSTISVAGVSVQVDRRLRSQASTEALAGLSGLSADGVRTLMMLTRGQPIYRGEDIAAGRADREYGELIKTGLAELQWADDKQFGPGSKDGRGDRTWQADPRISDSDHHRLCRTDRRGCQIRKRIGNEVISN